MGENKRVKTSIYLDRELWARFKRAAMLKYNFQHGSVTLALEEALRKWLEENAS